MRLFISFSRCVTCDTAPPCRHVSECYFRAPLFCHSIVLSSLYFARMPLTPGLFIIVLSPPHLNAYTHLMSMSPKFLSSTAVLGVPTVERPWYPIFAEASPWHTGGLSVLAAGSALTRRGGTASVLADVGAQHDRTSQQPSVLIRVQRAQVPGPLLISESFSYVSPYNRPPNCPIR